MNKLISRRYKIKRYIIRKLVNVAHRIQYKYSPLYKYIYDNTDWRKAARGAISDAWGVTPITINENKGDIP